MIDEGQLKELGLQDDLIPKISELATSVFSQKQAEWENEKLQLKSSLDDEFRRGAGKSYQNISDTITELTGLKKIENEKESDFLKRAIKERINAQVESEKIKFQKTGEPNNDLLQKLSIFENKIQEYENKEKERVESENLNKKMQLVKKFLPKSDVDEFLREPRENEFIKGILESKENLIEINNELFVGNKSLKDIINSSEISKLYIKNENNNKQGFNIDSKTKVTATDIDAIITQSDAIHKGNKAEAKATAKKQAMEVLIQNGLAIHSAEFRKRNTEMIDKINNYFK